MSDVSLRKFITQVITEINAGIVDAITQAEASDSSYRINPIAKNAHENWKPYEQKIEFDVALTVTGGVRAAWALIFRLFPRRLPAKRLALL